ncbi:SHOCT domain-containing protein [Hamadaea tsunoensis]|uniref:SHOCT domain-containing protein n=1 Tax=Hamadaea tsunoensis TaxID=53368 RepID=UPI000428981F|nr:SHOCT domain-containing protein [Hamadaea tsunoensis]
MITAFATHAYHGGGWWFFAPWLWIPFWFLIFFVIRGLFWRRHRHHHGYGWGPGWHGGESDPRVILAQRYARGEISEQEYTERLAVLNTPPANPR